MRSCNNLLLSGGSAKNISRQDFIICDLHRPLYAGVLDKVVEMPNFDVIKVPEERSCYAILPDASDRNINALYLDQIRKQIE